MTTLTQQAPAASRKLDRLLAHYAESHRNPRNELIHFVAIPAIMLSLVGLLFSRIEGRKPSFFEDLQYLWIGPLFVLSRLFVRIGLRW